MGCIKTTTVSFVANKGGVSKTRHTILTANYLGKCNKKVLVIDLDSNNSTSYYYLSPEQDDLAKTKNAFYLLSDESNKLEDFALETIHENVFIIPSSRKLADIRTLTEKRLSRIIKNSTDEYDVIIIDCGPTYDNIVLNAINSSDIIITPVIRDIDSYNSAWFMKGKLLTDTDKIDNWYITINGYNHRYDNSKRGRQKEFLDLYKKEFEGCLVPESCWFPWTSDMNLIKDEEKALSEKSGIRGAVCNPNLYNAVASLASCFVEDDELPRPDSF